jgi:predicted transcriptional regulator
VIESREQILISLDGRHAESILEGRKQVELRRRPMNVEIGATLWIYAKLPVGSIVGFASIAAVRSCAPASLWRRFGKTSGVSRVEFFDYFRGVDRGTALELTGCKKLRDSISLEALRRLNARFHPPQFFIRLKQGGPILAGIVRASGVQTASD